MYTVLIYKFNLKSDFACAFKQKNLYFRIFNTAGLLFTEVLYVAY